MKKNNQIIGVVGLGYVGLPLAAILSQKYECIGYDIAADRIQELSKGVDRTGELTNEEMNNLGRLKFSCDSTDLKHCDFFIITVPTPVNNENIPDFGPLESASKLIGGLLKKDDIVVYESTVYPGATEEICVPILERYSGLQAGDDFFYGYSPERINPGDLLNRVENIIKVTSGCNETVAKVIDDLYASVIVAGTFKAASVKVAEAAKVIENAQRDVNIAFMNQISMIFGNLGIDTSDVLDAAATKWNFMKFSPGLVGGHCIGVDPYYLIKKAVDSGCAPKLLKVSREINEGVPQYIADRLIASLGPEVTKLPILILGATFKENCPDLRNSKVKELYDIFIDQGYEVTVTDPRASLDELGGLYSNTTVLPKASYSAIVLAVAHDDFFDKGFLIHEDRVIEGGVIFDVKSKIKDIRNDITLMKL